MTRSDGALSPSDGAPMSLDRLVAIMRRLRDPVTGCEWDRVQIFATIAPYTIEEAYEVADAIARGDMDALADELGDLQLQVVFHARMAEEAGAFHARRRARRRSATSWSAAIRTSSATPRHSPGWEALKAAERAEAAG